MGLERRRLKKKEKKRETILKAARKLFLEKGFRHVTVEDIARKAEMGKGSVYLYFTSKDEIYSQILLRDIEKFSQKVAGICASERAASELLKEFSHVYVDFFLRDKELFRILMTFMLQANHTELQESVHTHMIRTTNKAMEVIEEILRRGVESGEFVPHVQVRTVRYGVWGLLNGIIALFLFVVPEPRARELIKVTIDSNLQFLLEGLRKQQSG